MTPRMRPTPRAIARRVGTCCRESTYLTRRARIGARSRWVACAARHRECSACRRAASARPSAAGRRTSQVQVGAEQAEEMLNGAPGVVGGRGAGLRGSLSLRVVERLDVDADGEREDHSHAEPVPAPRRERQRARRAKEHGHRRARGVNVGRKMRAVSKRGVMENGERNTSSQSNRNETAQVEYKDKKGTGYKKIRYASANKKMRSWLQQWRYNGAGSIGRERKRTKKTTNVWNLIWYGKDA
eukprot:6186462-Pleurochrysis_carterae.AAC.4